MTAIFKWLSGFNQLEGKTLLCDAEASSGDQFAGSYLFVLKDQSGPLNLDRFPSDPKYNNGHNNLIQGGIRFDDRQVCVVKSL